MLKDKDRVRFLHDGRTGTIDGAVDESGCVWVKVDPPHTDPDLEFVYVNALALTRCESP